MAINNPDPSKNHFPAHHSAAKTKQPLKKLWRIAQTRRHFGLQQAMNSSIEDAFMKVLKQIKLLLATHSQTVFERNQKHDCTDSAEAIYSFVSPSFYFHLSCDFGFDYQVEYAFKSCPCEEAIRKLLLVYPLREKAKEVILQPDFATFYNAVLAYQSKEHIYSLKAE